MVFSALIKKLMFVRQFDIDQGKITMLGDREIMLSASALLALQEIDQTKMYDIAKKSGFKNISSAVEHAKVYGKVKDVFIAEIALLGKKIGETDAGMIKTLQDIFNVYGLGEMSIQEIDNKTKQANILVKDSTMAEEYSAKNKGKSKTGACAITAGVIAGVFSYIFGKQVDCVEGKCKASGDGYCLFKVA